LRNKSKAVPEALWTFNDSKKVSLFKINIYVCFCEMNLNRTVILHAVFIMNKYTKREKNRIPKESNTAQLKMLQARFDCACS
jgi:hypothetical protein